jgi:hypothetical protein
VAQYVKLAVFMKTEFVEGHAPSRKTLKRLIQDDEIAGKKIGRDYYVDLQKFNLTGNSLVDSVLLAS